MGQAISAIVVLILGRSLSAFLQRIGLGFIIDSAIDWVTKGGVIDAIKNGVMKTIVEYSASRWGIQLDENEPLSPASLSQAVSLKTGIAIRDVTNKETTRADLLAHVVGSLKDRTGLELSDVSNAETIKADVLRFASGQAGEKLGFPIRDMTNADMLREDLKQWCEEDCLRRIVAGINGQSAEDRDFAESVMRMTVSRPGALGEPGKPLSPAKLLTAVNAAMARTALPKIAEVHEMTKRERRRELNRLRQREFRERVKAGKRVGGFMVYVPIGFEHKMHEQTGEALVVPDVGGTDQGQPWEPIKGG